MENYINSSDISARGIRRHLEGQERDRLEKQGCRADRWEDVEISESTSLDAIHDVDFAGGFHRSAQQGSRDRCWNARLKT